jgi:hypothetical protein
MKLYVTLIRPTDEDTSAYISGVGDGPSQARAEARAELDEIGGGEAVVYQIDSFTRCIDNAFVVNSR